MSGHESLVVQALARRESWVELDERRAVKIRRPAETELATIGRALSLDKLVACVVGWRGFTLADAIGEGETALDFDAELWRVLAADSVVWSTKVAEAVAAAVGERARAAEAAAGNSLPS
jgi:hypothetical protein